jgi:hypothetical protein
MRAIIVPVIFPFSLCVSPKDSLRFNLLQLNRQTDSVPSQNWSSLMVVTDARVHIHDTPNRRQNCVALNRLATYILCATDPLQMIGSRVLVIINFALFYLCLTLSFEHHCRLQGFYLYVWSQATLTDGQAVTHILKLTCCCCSN